MLRSRLTWVLGFGSLLLVAEPALADCVDVPAPEVYWRRCLQDGQDLRGVDLTGATLRDASFKRADLSDAILTDADARRAKFISAILHNTRLDGANLVRADLTKADLTDASLVGADLTNARLFRADLSRADLTGARLGETDLLHAVLAGATWTDGKTICSEDSVGQCHRSSSSRDLSDVEPSG
jgi:Pentapeptide repeats (8 copies)